MSYTLFCRKICKTYTYINHVMRFCSIISIAKQLSATLHTYVRVYVCMCVCTYVCIHVHTCMEVDSNYIGDITIRV